MPNAGMGSAWRVVAVDDEPDVLLGLKILIQGIGAEVKTATDAETALPLIREWAPHVVVSDIAMPGMTGMELLRQIKSVHPHTQVILITGYGTIPMAVEAMQIGASHFLTKPFDNDELTRAVATFAQRAMTLGRRETDSRTGGHDAERNGDDGSGDDGSAVTKLVGRSAAMKTLRTLIARVAPTDATVLIDGESGTGKELVARAVHAASPRRNKPFIAVNTAALPEALLESELFGHRKGAFTGAADTRLGIFREAEGGTVFLDEVASMPAVFQGKLLRVLQDHAVIPLGTSKALPVDFRLVAATNRDLKQMAATGEFRHDLYYRLQVMTIHVPPLRDRPDDILPLAEHFLLAFGGDARLSPAAELALQQYSWPGNVRELENCIQRAVILSLTGTIEPKDLCLAVPTGPAPVSAERPSTGNGSPDDAASLDAIGAPGWVDPRTVSYDEAKRFVVEQFQRQYIERALEREDGNITRAAQMCGLTRAAFQRIMRTLGLSRDDFTG